MPEKLDSLDEIHAQELFDFKRTRNRVRSSLWRRPAILGQLDWRGEQELGAVLGALEQAVASHLVVSPLRGFEGLTWRLAW